MQLHGSFGICSTNIVVLKPWSNPSWQLSSSITSLKGNNPSDQEFCIINLCQCPRCLPWPYAAPQPQGCFSLESSARPPSCASRVLQRVKSSLKNAHDHFPLLLLLGVCRFMAQFYFPAPGAEQRALPPASISLCCRSFLIWKYSLPSLALISGLLCCSYFSPGFARLRDSLPSISLTLLTQSTATAVQTYQAHSGWKQPCRTQLHWIHLAGGSIIPINGIYYTNASG